MIRTRRGVRRGARRCIPIGVPVIHSHHSSSFFFLLVFQSSEFEAQHAFYSPAQQATSTQRKSLHFLRPFCILGTLFACVCCAFSDYRIWQTEAGKKRVDLQLWLAVRIIVWELERQRSLSERRARNAALVLPTSSASSSFCSLRRTSTFDQARLCNPNTTHVVSGNDG